MKKMSLFMGMIAFISITTSCEQDLQSDTTVNAKSGFDAEATYYSIVDNTESGMQQFDALTNAQKAAVWEFKYERFKADNTLSIDQIAAIDVATDLVKNISFSEGNETAEQAADDEIRNVFDADVADFLVLTLENSGSDVATEGCFWCRDEIPGTAGNCYAVLNTDGNPTGDFQYLANARLRRFWVGLETIEDVAFPCSEGDWDAGGRQMGN